jgi:heme oxygenase
VGEASLLTQLRANTSELHRDVEQLPSMARLLGPIELEEYVELLQRFWRFHTSQEARLALDELPRELQQRPNVALLERDLAGFALGAHTQQARASTAESLGVLYVLEGSALGGTVIARHLERRSALAGRTAFFNRPRAEVAARWRSFCRVLAAYDAQPPPFRSGVLDGARSAFLQAKTALGDD